MGHQQSGACRLKSVTHSSVCSCMERVGAVEMQSRMFELHVIALRSGACVRQAAICRILASLVLAMQHASTQTHLLDGAVNAEQQSCGIRIARLSVVSHWPHPSRQPLLQYNRSQSVGLGAWQCRRMRSTLQHACHNHKLPVPMPKPSYCVWMSAYKCGNREARGRAQHAHLSCFLLVSSAAVYDSYTRRGASLMQSPFDKLNSSCCISHDLPPVCAYMQATPWQSGAVKPPWLLPIRSGPQNLGRTLPSCTLLPVQTSFSSWCLGLLQDSCLRSCAPLRL